MRRDAVIMTILDAILLFAIISFACFGWKLGIIKAGGYLLAVFLGAFVAGRFYEPMAELVGGGNFARVASFAFIGFLVTRIVKFLIWLIDKAFNVLTIIPFTSALNRLIGGLLGLFGSMLAFGLLLTVLEAHTLNHQLDSAIAHSGVAAMLVVFSKILLPLLPYALQMAGE